MSSFESTKRDLQVSRSRKIGSIHGLNGAEDDKEEIRDYFYSLLFGNSDLGIMDYFTVAYSIAYNLVGFDTSKPSLRQGDDSDWKNQFEQAVTQSGDDEFYLTDSNGLGESEINESTEWLNDNDPNGVTDQGFISNYNSNSLQISSTIGEEASENGDGRGPEGFENENGDGFDTEQEAIDYADSSVSTGSDLLGKRTRNVEDIYRICKDINGDIVDCESTDVETEHWYVGTDGPETPDYFNDPENNDLLTSINSIISDIDSAINDIESYVDILESLIAEENPILEEAEVRPDVQSDTQNLIDDLNSRLIEIEDERAEFQSYYDYFSNFTAGDDISDQTGYIQSEFNTKANDLLTYIDSTSSLDSIYQNTQSDVIGHFGSINSGWKKWRYFWIKQAIKKPDGPMFQLNGISSSRTSTYNDLDDASDDLSAIESNEDRWMPQPITIAAFYEPNIDDETGNVIQKRSHLIWRGSEGANLYEIRRIKIGDLPSNPNDVDSWPSPTIIKMGELNLDSGLVITSYVDSSVEGGTEYAYAVKAFDIDDPEANIHRIDSFDSGSASSLVYDENESYTVDFVEEIPSGLRLTLNEEHEFSAGEHIYIDGLGFARINNISNARLDISRYSVSQLDGATVYPAPGIVLIP